jgi:rSAM/selenodomain-associated transferase 1
LAKTRLAARVGDDAATALARAFLLDTVENVQRAAGVDARAVCRDDADASAIRSLIGDDVPVLVQSRPGLGAALEECFAHGLADGYHGVAVLGSDSPTLPPNVLTSAFEVLDGRDVAIGPCPDGGYYLLSARGVHPSLFRDMVWSTPDVFQETLVRCAIDSLRVATLPTWLDVDTPDDLDALVESLADSDAAPNTRRALSAIGLGS